MRAILLLYERSYKTYVVHEGTQANKISTSTSFGTETIDPRPTPPPHMIIKPGAIVYALWTDDDGLFYQVS